MKTKPFFLSLILVALFLVTVPCLAATTTTTTTTTDSGYYPPQQPALTGAPTYAIAAPVAYENEGVHLWLGIGGSYPIGNSVNQKFDIPIQTGVTANMTAKANTTFGGVGEVGLRGKYFGIRGRYDYYLGDASMSGNVSYQGQTVGVSMNPTYSASDYFGQIMFFVPMASENSDLYIGGGIGMAQASFSLGDKITATYQGQTKSVSVQNSTITASSIAYPVSAGFDLAMSKNFAINLDATYMIVGDAEFKSDGQASGVKLGSYFIPSVILKFTF